MITWQKFQKDCDRDPWLRMALIESKHVDDTRPLRRRVEQSVAQIVFKPFEHVDPTWRGMTEFHPFFNDKSGRQDGALVTRHPLVIYKRGDRFSWLRHISSGAKHPYTVGESIANLKVKWVAIVRPFIVKLMPHYTFAESYEVFKFPEDFGAALWSGIPKSRYEGSGMFQAVVDHIAPNFDPKDVQELKTMGHTAMVRDALNIFTTFKERQLFIKLYVAADDLYRSNNFRF